MKCAIPGGQGGQGDPAGLSSLKEEGRREPWEWGLQRLDSAYRE